MSLFDEKSRYARVEPYEVRDRRGRTVPVIPPAEPPGQDLAGYHVRRQGQRLDHMAARYLDDPAGYWRICELNDVMLPESLSEAREIAIPTKGR
jgi:hypothetical protein